MDVEQKIMSLMLVAEDHQAAVDRELNRISSLLDDLQAVRKSFNTDYSKIQALTQSLNDASFRAQEQLKEILPKLRGDIKHGVTDAVKGHFEIVKNHADSTLKDAFAPLLKSLDAAIQRADMATEKANNSVKFFSSKIYVLLFLSISALITSGFIAVKFMERSGF